MSNWQAVLNAVMCVNPDKISGSTTQPTHGILSSNKHCSLKLSFGMVSFKPIKITDTGGNTISSFNKHLFSFLSSYSVPGAQLD